MISIVSDLRLELSSKEDKRFDCLITYPFILYIVTT